MDKEELKIIACRLEGHIWEEHFDHEHWRRCLKCNVTELGHAGWHGPSEWHPTNYPNWDRGIDIREHI